MEEFVFVKRDGRLRLVGRAVEEYPAWVEQLGEGEHFRGSFKALSTSKSQEQLGYYYGVMLPDVVEGLRQLGWSEVGFEWIAGTHVPLAVNAGNVDRYLKVLYAASRNIEATVSKARMSKQQMHDLIEFVLAWAHENSIAVRPSEKHVGAR